jgi:hypothetical protein
VRSGLRKRSHKLLCCSAIATRSNANFHQRHRNTRGRLRALGRHANLRANCHRHYHPRRLLERQRNCWRQPGHRHGQRKRRLHRACNSACTDDCHSSRAKRRRPNQASLCYRNDPQRRRHLGDAGHGRRRARRVAVVPCRNQQQRPPRHFHSLEHFWSRVPGDVRLARRKRQLHRTSDLARCPGGYAYGAKRRRSFQASLRNRHHHQQFFSATFRAAERRVRRLQPYRRNADANRWLESIHRVFLGRLRPRMAAQIAGCSRLQPRKLALAAQYPLPPPTPPQ